MRLSRTDLIPVMTIVAGGVIGASLSFGLLGSRSEDVSVAARSTEMQSMVIEGVAKGLTAPKDTDLIAFLERRYTEGRSIVCMYSDGDVFRLDFVDRYSDRVERSPYGQWQNPLVCIDGVAVETSIDLVPEDIESTQLLRQDVAVPLYGARGSDGVIRITLNTDPRRRP